MARSSKPTNEMLGFVQDEYGALTIDDIVIPPPPVAALSYDVPDKRLIITQLRITDFKSYAGEVVLGPFNKNFTAVVGPNGSGKSNVIDSLLFVFGYRAKKIRSKKVSYLIHKSDQHPNVHSCSVTVQFATIKEDGDSYEIIPGTEFVLSRTAFSDDSSYYEIGGKRAPYKEVARALRRYGIDLEHSRFLILQGEIEAISLMQPKGPNEHECGMLEYIEDIIGTNRYIEPIGKLKEKVDKLNEEKNEKFNTLKLVEKEKDELEDPKNKAIEFLRLENKLILNQNLQLHYERYNAEKELENIVESKKKFQENLNKLKAEINEIKNSRKGQEADLEKINSELETHIKDVENYKELYKTLERQDVAISMQLKNISIKKSKLEDNLETAKNELSKLKKQSETYENETEELNKMKKQHESTQEKANLKLQEVMDSLKSRTQALQEQKDQLEAEQLQMNKKVDNLKSEMELLQSEHNLHLRTDKQLKETLRTLESKLEDAEMSSKEEEQALEKEKERIQILKNDYETALKQIEDSRESEANLTDQYKTALSKYEEARNSYSTFTNRSAMLKAFAEEKSSGRLTGVYGRLGDLGAIDEKYDVAISTACGQLNHIVTDTMETAQECVLFLKKNKLGYMTFIPLDKMEKWIPYAHSKINTPENVPRLFDLVRVKDEKLLPAFYHALKDTLVADNLEQATRIGLQGSKRYRVVTLKGELIELSGTMSGGGGFGKSFHGAMGQKVVECSVSNTDVLNREKEMKMAGEAARQVRTFIMRLQNQISEKAKELSTLQLSVKKRQRNFEAYQGNAEVLRTQIEQQKKKMESSSVDQEKVTELEKQIAKKREVYNEASREAADTAGKVQWLQDEIIKITKGSINAAKKKVDQANKDVNTVSESITKSSVNMKTCKRNIKKAEDKTKSIQRDVETAERDRTRLQDAKNNAVKEASECVINKDKAQAAVDQLREKRAELKKEFKTFEEKEQKLKLEEIDQKNKLKEEEALESVKRSRVKQYTAQLAKLKLNEVEGDSTELPSLSPEEINKLSIQLIESDIYNLEEKKKNVNPNLSAITEYKKKEKLYNEKQKDYDEILKERNKQNTRFEALRERRLLEFMKGFTAIAKKLKETYQMLAMGGDAELEIVDKFDPFQKGIEFSVRPHRKSWKYMRNLSGGEKTLSSLALVFALHYYRPTPFYVMDEIDAALDVENVAIVGYYLKECTKNTQFIIVSLRNIMNELSDHLIGIYKTDNCSKNISLMMASKWKEEDEKASQKF